MVSPLEQEGVTGGKVGVNLTNFQNVKHYDKHMKVQWVGLTGRHFANITSVLWLNHFAIILVRFIVAVRFTITTEGDIYDISPIIMEQ